MSKTVQITSASQFNTLISSSTIVVTDFYADWCGPCKAIAPLYEQLSAQLSRPNKITFCKVNTDQQQQIAASHGVTAMPTFLVFKNTKEVSRIRGADPAKLSEAVRKLAAEADASSSGAAGFGEASGSGSVGGTWRGVAALPRGYTDVTDQVDVRNLDMLNGDGDFGSARVLFESGRPSGLSSKAKGKGKEQQDGAGSKHDWVESDTDEQLMLYMPMQATLKIHTMHITSLAGATGGGDDEAPMRPKTLRLYVNRAHVLGFEEAEDVPATQVIELRPSDWDVETGTAAVELRFVKFQNVSSLVMFVVDGEGSGERCRIDRLRFIGETGERRAMGKLEKVGEEQ